MAYALVQGNDNSSVSGVLSLDVGPFTYTGGNTIIAVTVQATGSTATLTDTSGNTYDATQRTTAILGSSLFLYVCQNAIAGSNTVTGHSNSTNLSALFVAEYSGLATSGGVIGWAGLGQNGPGAGTDSVTSGGFQISVVAALLFALSIDNTGSSVPVGGTGFTGRGSIFANYTGGVRSITEDKRITVSGNYAGTFQPSVAGHTGDLFNTIAVALPEIGAVGPSVAAWWKA